MRRPRLTARLSAGLRGPLTLLVAPAGFGKTTLLADWRATQQEGAQDIHRSVAWLALDAGDNDLARFLRYVVAALRTLHADLGGALLASLRSPQLPPVEALLTLLLNDLVTLADDVILVLDDYHVIDAPAIHQAMSFLLDHLPLRVHLVIATRTEPPLPLARLRARGQLSELRVADLRFSADEATAFLTQTMGLPLSANDVATLESYTEGWIAGDQQRGVRYSAGLLLLDRQDPRRILYRSTESILAPDVAAERLGVVPRVVFPTGLDARPDGALDIYYGMADTRVGVARAWLDDLLMPARAQSAA